VEETKTHTSFRRMRSKGRRKKKEIAQRYFCKKLRAKAS